MFGRYLLIQILLLIAPSQFQPFVLTRFLIKICSGIQLLELRPMPVKPPEKTTQLFGLQHQDSQVFPQMVMILLPFVLLQIT